MLTTVRRRMSKPWRSVAFKISVLTCLLVLSVMAATANMLLRQTREAFIARMEVRAEFFARATREAIFPKLDAFQLHFHVKEIGQEKAVIYAAVLSEDGRILSHSDPLRIGERVTPPQPGLQARRGSYELAEPIMVGARRVGTALVGFDESSIEGALAETRRRIELVAAGAVALAILGTVLIVGWITRPLPLLAEAAEQIGRGNFGARVDWRSKDEIGSLARAFNDMAIANSLMFTAISQEKEKLETIFHGTREGIVWTDPRGKILLINPSARNLLGCRERAVDEIKDAARGFEALPALPELFSASTRTTPFELTRKDPKLLIVSGICDRLGDPKDPAGYLLVFHDATVEKRGETLSRSFLSLVSHKLRTPLAVALGFTEMIAGDDKNLTDFQKNAVAKIRQESDKLRRLVEKLITFSTVQSPQNIVLEKAPTAVLDAVEGALKANADEIEKRDATVRWSRDELAQLDPIQADPMLLKECVSAFVENALKFNKGDDPMVTVAAARRNGRMRVAVCDNGPGIPEEEHPKLFRKFYQIDPDFTGQIAGFGLGLAFVKNVIEAHGGSVGLRSTPGSGSEFFFELPAK